MAVRDGYSVAEGHCLVIPKRHVIDYWGLTSAERDACHDLLVKLKNITLAEDMAVTGFNIGLNAGESSGQTVFHCHIHLIPRRHGDVPDPRGGIRCVIPGKAIYDPNRPPRF